MKKVSVDMRDLYQMLVTECRYGYTQNNHFMPEGAFEHCRTYITKMLSVDKEWTLVSLNQLCDECITNLCYNFPHGDNFYGNRDMYIKFIEWCLNILKENNKPYPYNYEAFVENKYEDDIPKYTLYNDLTNEPLTTEPISKNQIHEYIAKATNNPNFKYERRYSVDGISVIYDIEYFKPIRITRIK